MTSIALPRPVVTHRASGIDTVSPTITLDTLAAVPNKHIPVCPPGPPTPPRSEDTPTPPRSPESAATEYSEADTPESLLWPPSAYPRLDSGSLALFKISAAELVRALDHAARRPLPDPSQIFPWFHGLHPQNELQQTFFVSRRRAGRRPPTCFRGITIVKADGDMTRSRLKGAIAPGEFLDTVGEPLFLDVDPKDGFSARNFHIQPAKVATTSDIVVYGDDDVYVRKLAWDVVAAQARWREKQLLHGHEVPEYNTFICTSPFRNFEQRAPEIVAIDSAGTATGTVLDFFLQERREMYAMSAATEISHNVWLGPTPDPSTHDEDAYDILIECSEVGRLCPSALQAIAESPSRTVNQPYLDFPSSGSIPPPVVSHAEADAILETCRWIYHIAHGTLPGSSAAPSVDADGDSAMGTAAAAADDDDDEEEAAADHPAGIPRKILIHCADGYTETSMLGIAYYSYGTGRPIPDAWLSLHTALKRNFFAYGTDVTLLTAIAPRLLAESPACPGRSLLEITNLVRNEPRWFAALDGSLPSRVLNYMYLGNLNHANNPGLLRAIGIGQLLSVGEAVSWSNGQLEAWGADNVYSVRGVQDNGIDPLTDEFPRCLEFIDRGRRNGKATLVHCRVGVSRSATICIAEVMRAMDMSFPRAYCFVRARRLNVIIQPHLRFAYELLKWEEFLKRSKSADGQTFRRELEWAEIAREIAIMNKPYAR